MKLRAILALTPLLFLAGCFCSVQVSDEGGRKLCLVENSGWKLFNLIPIASGDIDYPNREVCVWFENTVNLKNNIRLLEEEQERRGLRNLRDLCSYKTEEQAFFFLFKRYTYHTSAELLP